MAKKILNTLTNNVVYKILAVVLAIILWFVVYYLDDPTITKTFTTNVTITNADVLTDMNLTYELADGSNTVTFRVSGARSYFERLEDSSFTATADMSNIIIDESQESATIPITITSSLYSSSLTYPGDTKYLSVTLDSLMSKQFVISSSTVGTVAEGYSLVSVVVQNPTVLKVSGPSSIVSTIDKVVAVINVDNMSSDLTDNAVPVLYDVDGNEIDSTRLTFSSDSVTVTASILPTKEVALTFTPSGVPEDGYEVTQVALEPSTITIRGSSSVLNAISAIEIPAEVLSVDGINADTSTTVDVTEYLPDGTSLVNESDRTITIDVTIEGYISKQVTIPAENIEIIGIGSGLTAQLGQNNVVVTVTGMANVINDLTGESLTATIDVSGLEAGTHSAELVVSLADEAEYEVAEKIVTVVITDTSASSEASGDSETEE
ncbi:MAG: hypothetical protein LIO37_04120 [Clostridiales bacterium]|nr:hypothetical protein [Clostridiales bacterium]